MPKVYGQRCPVAKTLEVVGDRWTLLVVRDLLGRTRRFQDLQASLPGIAPNILSDRLKLDPSARKEIFEYYRMLTPIGYANALRALLQMDYITDRLREIEVPTLLVCGDQDLSLGPMREIQKRIPQAKFALLAPASHFANRDQPKAFNLAVVEFLMSLG